MVSGLLHQRGEDVHLEVMVQLRAEAHILAQLLQGSVRLWSGTQLVHICFQVIFLPWRNTDCLTADWKIYVCHCMWGPEAMWPAPANRMQQALTSDLHSVYLYGKRAKQQTNSNCTPYLPGEAYVSGHPYSCGVNVNLTHPYGKGHFCSLNSITLPNFYGFYRFLHIFPIKWVLSWRSISISKHLHYVLT